ncbi:hypothetical protein G6F42_020695 [Rhizopus arrhizus]|nr:hypothetical protein G6F42_020695 [Rhizopus arrhizus]
MNSPLAIATDLLSASSSPSAASYATLWLLQSPCYTIATGSREPIPVQIILLGPLRRFWQYPRPHPSLLFTITRA